ncbi:hypothetical protein GF386_00490 [Candidatus Pacearchaeota archaeon]|nr:hypothetical protein [Candidatus Pacearchaeota archaeon]
MRSKILILILVISLLFNAIFVITLIPFKTQEDISALKTCVSDFDCGSGLECLRGTFCDNSNNCITTNYCQLKEANNNNEVECGSSLDCEKCGNSCMQRGIVMRTECPETTENFDCKCEDNKCVKKDSELIWRTYRPCRGAERCPDYNRTCVLDIQAGDLCYNEGESCYTGNCDDTLKCSREEQSPCLVP